MTDFLYRAFEMPDGTTPRSPRDRLVPPMPGSALWGWIGPLIVTVFGAFLRFYRLSVPNAFAWDETYYAKDGFSMLTYGVERRFIEDADSLLLSGHANVYEKCDQLAQCATFVAHPPLGKWMIAFGELLFGVNPFGWRFASAVVGTLSILILARVARRMTRSTLLGCLAGFLLALDGLHFVLSRSALLDIFVMFWVLAAFACLINDRDWARRRLSDQYEPAIKKSAHEGVEKDPEKGVPDSALGAVKGGLGLRPWRLAAGVCLGLALSVKWSGIYFILVFAVMSLVWDAGARRAIGLRSPYVQMLRRDLPLAIAWMGVVPILTHLASFVCWFATDRGYGRNWEQATSGGPVFFVIDSMRSWIDYQKAILGFHTGMSTPHPYEADPWSWPLLLRPINIYKHCAKGSCASVLGTGTQVIWFGALLALIALIAWYTASRDWRAGAVLVGYAAGWLPWFYYAIADHRTMFFTYAVTMVPFMALAIALVFGLVIGRADATSSQRSLGATVVGAFMLLALVNFWWLYPILSAEAIPVQGWLRRMFLPSWI